MKKLNLSENNASTMYELNIDELEAVSGGADQISGYQGAGAVMGVLTGGVMLGAAVSLPVSAPIIAIGLGVAGGLAVAQWLAK